MWPPPCLNTMTQNSLYVFLSYLQKKKKKPQGSYLKKLIFLSAKATAFASPHCPIFFLLNATTMGENG